MVGNTVQQVITTRGAVRRRANEARPRRMAHIVSEFDSLRIRLVSHSPPTTRRAPSLGVRAEVEQQVTTAPGPYGGECPIHGSHCRAPSARRHRFPLSPTTRTLGGPQPAVPPVYPWGPQPTPGAKPLFSVTTRQVHVWCEPCKGRGWRSTPFEEENPDDEGQECDSCKGKGWYSVTETTTIKL